MFIESKSKQGIVIDDSSELYIYNSVNFYNRIFAQTMLYYFPFSILAVT